MKTSILVRFSCAWAVFRVKHTRRHTLSTFVAVSKQPRLSKTSVQGKNALVYLTTYQVRPWYAERSVCVQYVCVRACVTTNNVLGTVWDKTEGDRNPPQSDCSVPETCSACLSCVFYSENCPSTTETNKNWSFSGLTKISSLSQEMSTK